LRRLTEGEDILAFCISTRYFRPVLEKGSIWCDSRSDFQPKDKQKAIEFVMEKKAGKKTEEQEIGEDK